MPRPRPPSWPPRYTSCVVRFLILAVLLLSTGCGAGVIGGVFASNRRPGVPEVRAVAVDKPWVAYFGHEGDGRLVTVTGYEAPAPARVDIALRIPGVVDRRGEDELPYLDWEQPNAKILEVLPRVTRMIFSVNTTGLGAHLADAGIDLSREDLAAQLVVQVNDVDVVPPIPFRIHRLMQATLQFSRPGATEEVVSVAGGSEFTCRLRGHPAEVDDFEIDLATFDPNDRNAALRQRITSVRVESIAGTDELLLRATAPANAFPARVFASVRHVQAGLSTPIEPLYYGPEIGFVAPVTVSTDGGSRTLVAGAGLVPLTFPGALTVAEPNYDQIELWVDKGGRRTQVSPDLIQRRPASLSRLVFDVPAAPDGRPGVAALILRVDLRTGGIGAVVEARATGLFAYGDTAPYFGVRGTRLPTRPQHVALGHIEDSAGAVDAVACSGSLPNVHLFVSSDNGMMRRFGAPWIAGASSELGERRPQRLLVQDFDGDRANDVMVLNGGDDFTASHTLLLGKPAPAAPLVAAGAVVRSGAAAATMVYGDIDGNGMVDVVVLPPITSKLAPEVCLSFGAAGTPAVVVSPLTDVIEGYDVVELADMDADGALDLAFARGGANPAFLSMYGRGDGSFVMGQSLYLEQIAGYTPREDTRAVGLHSIGDHRLRGVALVLAGQFQVATRATITVLDYVGVRQHDLPRPARTLGYNESQAFVRSVAADLDRDGIRELVVASQTNASAASLHVFAWRTSLGEPAFVELAGAVDVGAEPMQSITSLGVGPAVDLPGASVSDAVFVTHYFLISDEERISTLLIDRSGGDLRLLPPDGTRRLPHTIDGVALGRFRGAAGSVGGLDVVAASSGARGGQLRGLRFFANDGAGVLTPGLSVTHSLLAGTITTLGRAGGDAALFLDVDRTLHVVQPSASDPGRVMTLAFDPFLPVSLRGLPLQAESKLATGDVDGDGIDDVVALLVFPSGGAPTEQFGQLLLLSGRNAPAEELPFTTPDPAVVTTIAAHGSARDLVLGDFAMDGAAPRRLEVAVAVAGSVNHVRFFAVDRPLDPPQVRGLRRSFQTASAQFLIAGDGPERLAATDVDGDGIVDLAVASATDRQLRVFSITSAATAEVDIASFRQLPIGLVTLPEGALRQLILCDINRDTVVDIMVSAESAALMATVRYYLATGTGQFANPIVIPSIRTGDHIWTSQGLMARFSPIALAVGELNSDDAVDLVIGWSTFGPDDRNFYLLFGGTR